MTIRIWKQKKGLMVENYHQARSFVVVALKNKQTILHAESGMQGALGLGKLIALDYELHICLA